MGYRNTQRQEVKTHKWLYESKAQCRFKKSKKGSFLGCNDHWSSKADNKRIDPQYIFD